MPASMSRSGASSNTSCGLLPPSSSVAGLGPCIAHEAMIARAGACRAGEGHLRDQRVPCERLAGGHAVAVHDIEDAARHAGLDRQLGQPQHRVGRQLRGLEHHRVAGGQRGADFPRGHHEREVPRRDRADHAIGFGHDHAQVVMPRRRDLAAQLVAVLGEEAQALGGEGHVPGCGIAHRPCRADRLQGARRATSASTRSAQRRSTRARSRGARRAQSLRRKAWAASCTAASTVAASAIGSPAWGLPSRAAHGEGFAAGSKRPPMKWPQGTWIRSGSKLRMTWPGLWKWKEC